MDLDSAVIWLATRCDENFSKSKSLGVSEDLLLGPGKLAWRFLEAYRQEHGALPSPGIISENSGQNVVPVEDGVVLPYVVEKLQDRAQFRALKYGLSKSMEALEKGGQAEAVAEVHKLSEHLRRGSVERVRIHTLAEVVPEVRELYERTKRGETGIPFPWPTMTAVTMGMWPQTLTGFVGRPGTGKCVHEDTLVVDPVTGVPLTIREFCESDRSRVSTWSKSGGVFSVQVDAKIDSGTKECLRVVTRTGREAIVTPEHPLLTPEGWRRADEMCPGMSLGVPARMPFPEEPQVMAPWEIDLLALLLADGSYTSKAVAFSTVDDVILAVAQNAAEKMGVDVKKVPDSDCDYKFVKKQHDRTNAVKQLLRRYGMDGKKAQQKSFPDAIFRLSKEGLCRFISIFWMCDGYVCRGDIEIVLSSKKMLQQLQSLLLRVGVQSRLSPKPTKYKGETRDAWRLRVASKSAERFFDAICLWGHRRDNLLNILDKKRNPNTGFPIVSADFIDKIKAISSEMSGRHRGGFHKKVAKELGRTKFQTRDLFGARNSLKMTAFIEFCKTYGVENEHSWLWDSDLFWDEVMSIEDVGVQRVYDLTVLPTECFVANDIVMHNTFTLINIADHAHFVSGKRVLVVSPEMTRVELAERQVALRGKFNYGDLVGATLGTFVEPKLYETIQGLTETAQNYFILDDEDRLGASYIEEAVDAVKPDLLGIDSLYMLRVADGKIKGGPGSKGGRYDRILDTVDWMRGFCRRAGMPFIAISQLSRGAEVKKGAKKALKKGHGTGGMENALAMTDTLFWDFHNLFAMYQDQDMRQDKQMLYVPLKARRQAKISSIVARWDLDEMDFSEIGTEVQESAFDDSSFDDVIL